MPDIFTRKKRSEVMSRIRSRGNKETEIALMRILRQNKISGWRRHALIRITNSRPSRLRVRSIRLFIVRPDFVFRARRVALFVDGCFWHACPKHSNLPANNRPFWRKKLSANQRRDRLVNRALKKAGWRVLRVWEHELNPKHRPRLRLRLERSLK
jgi:DNA mismatch endonuclease, patch repair protein